MFTLKKRSPVMRLFIIKKYINLKDIIKVNRYPNIIIHGCSNSGKTFLINYIFKIKIMVPQEKTM